MNQKHSALRLSAFLLAMLMLLSFGMVACNNDTTEPDDEETTTQSTTVTTAPTTTAPTTTEKPATTDKPTTEEKPGTEDIQVITVAEALELCGETGNITTDRYYIRGIIQTVTNAQYGAMVIADETGSISVYGTYSEDGSLTYTQLDYMPVKGDEVLLHCILQNYNGTKEVKNARLISYVNNQGNIDTSGYTEATISETRAAEKGANLKVTGVVARITYANGMKPNGFILVDDASSIYVYDMDAAQRVQIGNKIEITGTKDYWILESEQSSANKFGYKGCSQLTDVTLVSNDNKTDNAITLDWVTETTIKDILTTPVTEDITTLVYKVTALVKKVPGNGFTNYYFFDLDGETGNYTYTQCNGSDFAWLDAFDGKICTVYITALNAKSSATGCAFRFLPVSVKDEGFQFDTANTGSHVLKYYVVDQFESSYSANPTLELITKVSSELLGFTDAKISYSSSNNAVISFTTKNGKTVMECKKSGDVTITATVTYDGKTTSEEIKVSVKFAEESTADNVKTAIDAKVGDTVTVQGIVGPSLVNRDGFYLMDESGMIAVVVADKAILGTIELGQKVELTGMRDRFHDNVGSHAGQTCITKATIVTNYYGNHEYYTGNFITDKTLEDFYNLDVNVDYSTTVFVLKATVLVEGNAYYTNIKLTDGTNKVTLYCSSAAQYEFLKQFENQEVTMEIAPCNWNNKKFYPGCVLSVITENGKVYNTLNFDVN